jgi:transposase
MLETSLGEYVLRTHYARWRFGEPLGDGVGTPAVVSQHLADVVGVFVLPTAAQRESFHRHKGSPVAQEAIDLILGLYRVEHEAKKKATVGTAEHLALRRKKSASIRGKLGAWLERQQGLHPPKSPIGAAIRYGLSQWDELGRFLEDASIPLDNNASERSLRRVALGRKNFLFLGDVEAGSNIAGIYTLIATCEARGINPLAYLTDVIARVQDHPAQRLDELLPAAWAQADAA